jgi:protein SCO1
MPNRRRCASWALAAEAVAALAIALSAGACGEAGSTQTASSAPGAGGFDGAALPQATPVRDFTLYDQSGRPVSLSDYRGQVTVLAFPYATCGAPCVVIAQQIRGALDELPHPVPVLLISADPTADTARRVRRFLRSVSLAGRVRYLTGPPQSLRAVWRAYGVVPASAGAAAFARSASVLLLDRAGRERVIFQQEQLTPEALAHDIRKLS